MRLVQYKHLKLIWMAEYYGSAGNENSDELGRRGSSTTISVTSRQTGRTMVRECARKSS